MQSDTGGARSRYSHQKHVTYWFSVLREWLQLLCLLATVHPTVHGTFARLNFPEVAR